MNNRGLRHRVLRGFLFFSVIQFFLLVALAIYSYHYGEDQALSRLVSQKPAVWHEYQSIGDMPEHWRDQFQNLDVGTHEISGQDLIWLEGSEMHVHVIDNGKRTWRVVQFEEDDRSLEVVSVYGLFALLATVLLVAFGGWAAWLIADRVSRPLELLAEKVSTRNSESSVPLLAGAEVDGEVALLGRTLDQAFARVDAAMHRETTLARNISHELRTPLTVISTSLHGVGDPDPEFRAQALERARRACGEMELLTTACLELSRDPASFDTDSASARPIASVAETQITVTDQRLTIQNPVDPDSSSSVWSNGRRGEGFGLNILGQTCERLGWDVEFKALSKARVAVSFDFAST